MVPGTGQSDGHWPWCGAGGGPWGPPRARADLFREVPMGVLEGSWGSSETRGISGTRCTALPACPAESRLHPQSCVSVRASALSRPAGTGSHSPWWSLHPVRKRRGGLPLPKSRTSSYFDFRSPQALWGLHVLTNAQELRKCLSVGRTDTSAGRGRGWLRVSSHRCVAKQSRARQLRTAPLISQFLWARNPGTACASVFFRAQGYSQDHVSVGVTGRICLWAH